MATYRRTHAIVETDKRTRGYRSESGCRPGAGYKLESYIQIVVFAIVINGELV